MLTQSQLMHYRMERKLPTARNAAADCVANGKDSFREANLNRARLCYELYQVAAIAAPSLPDHTPDERHNRSLCLILMDVYSNSIIRYRKIKKLLTAESSDVILKRTKEEIDKSRCDSVVAFPAAGLKHRVLYPFVELSKDPRTNSLPPKFPAEFAERPEPRFSDLGGCPLIPVFLGVYRKENQTPLKAMHQSKLYLVSAVVFLASLGFKKQPVYAVVTDGTVGIVLCCWHSAESDVCCLLSPLFELCSQYCRPSSSWIVTFGRLTSPRLYICISLRRS